ncbi:MAG: CrcB family protein [Chloroflexi bacterium]|nr:CrcB family protein [Chloroflexota bacterium]MYD47302.1 CrcB family protein [Chloroflexota bacterium]
MVWLLVALGGAIGSVLRYGVNRLAAQYLGADTVAGTLAVNVAGSFALGFLATAFIERSGLPTELRVMATVGLLGGFTTFSTLAYDGVRLLSGGEYWRAGVSLAANLVIGLAAAWLGVLTARAAV